MTEQKEYRIVFLIYAEMNDEDSRVPEFELNLNEQIGKIKFSEKFHLAIVKNAIRLKNGSIESDKTHLYYKDENSKMIEFGHAKVNENVLQDGKKLGEAFRTIDVHFPAKKTILITLDHGNGFGIFQKQTSEPIEILKNNLEFSKRFKVMDQRIIKAGKMYNHFCIVQNQPLYNKLHALDQHTIAHIKQTFIKSSVNEDAIRQAWNADKIVDILTNDELKSAIEQGFGKVEVLIMFNCLMQNMLTCYSMKDVVDYIVAAEGVIIDPGYNYVCIAEALDKASLPREIANTAIDTLKAMYQDDDEESYNMQAISVLNLKEFTLFLKVFDESVYTLTDVIKTKDRLRSEIRSIRSNSYPFDHDYEVIDMMHFFDYLAESTTEDEIIRITDTIRMAYKKIVEKEPPIAEGAFKYTNVGNFWGPFYKRKPTGLSIHFPTEKMAGTGAVESNFTSVRALYPSSFLCDTNWRDFINCLYE